MDYSSEIQKELDCAEAARAAGNEGRARVCARRAAGLAARIFLARHGVRVFGTGQGVHPSGNAYQALQTLANLPDLAPNLKQATNHLTVRVGGKFSLPPGIDLIDEAHRLIGGLM